MAAAHPLTLFAAPFTHLFFEKVALVCNFFHFATYYYGEKAP
jgi:hypothetical protein